MGVLKAYCAYSTLIKQLFTDCGWQCVFVSLSLSYISPIFSFEQLTVRLLRNRWVSYRPATHLLDRYKCVAQRTLRLLTLRPRYLINSISPLGSWPSYPRANLATKTDGTVSTSFCLHFLVHVFLLRVFFYVFWDTFRLSVNKLIKALSQGFVFAFFTW